MMQPGGTPTTTTSAAVTTAVPPQTKDSAATEAAVGEFKVSEEMNDRGFGGNRWPRQETLALLNIRSDMGTSVKGPLWEDVSRKMAELGYMRNAEKCKEKFENLYQYHKRTKEGRTGKSEGKTYRFFDQLEALETPSTSSLHHQQQQPLQTAATASSGAAPRNDALEASRSAVLNPTSPATSLKKLELREKPKEVKTSFQQRLPEYSITGFDPILVISCGINQDSDETYFISCIFNELYMRGFTPCRYDLTRSTVTGNPEMLYRSRICIMIITMNCARSRVCLEKFVATMGHLEANNLALLPVFFNVKPGSFENSVPASHVQKWKKALNKLSVHKKHQYTKGDEVMLAKSIVRDVCLLTSSGTCRNLIGIKHLLESIVHLLQCPQPSGPQIVGLWGMAGIGKTAITREIFRTQAQRYDLSYFLPDFHLMCQTKGLSHLRDDFFSKILGEEKVFIDECDTKISFLRDRFLDKRVLIVLDGVSNARDAEVFVGGFGWFSGGHTIILTSRNRQVLVQCKPKELYEIPKLSEYESLRLCCQFATEQNWKGRMSLISELVNYASGIPLALRVFGSSVQKQCINNEKQHLRRLRQHPPIEVQDAFRKGFDRLDDDEKNIFLDLACFFRGENKDRVVNILDGCGFFADLGIYGLIDESLISLVDNKIEMPNIFQDMGRFVVCQENEEAGKRSRLWDSNDIVGVLTNNSGTEAIEGIFLNMSGLSFELSPTVFERMHRLRLLKLRCPTSENHWKVCLPQGLHSLPDEVRLLHWERYPLGSLPRNFNPKNLVELNMPYSNIKRLWKGTKNLKKLKRIILSHSRQMTKFPRLSKARNLEHIDLEGCVNLVKVNSSILHHQKLTFLSLKGCSHLRIMPPTVHIESLEVLNLSGCSELENLQDFSPNLKELYLAGTAIIELPSSIGDLTRLVTLDLENCERLQHLPPGISNLKVIITLKLSGCSNLKSLPNLDALFLRNSRRLNTKITKEKFVPFILHSAIQESRLDGSEILPIFYNLQLRPEIYDSCFSRDAARDRTPQESWPRVTITPFPSSILHSLASRLYALVSLFLCNAYLMDIPEDLCWLASVKTLDLGGNSFYQIPKSIKELHKLHSLRLRHCKNLRSLPELPRNLEILNAHGCVSLESFPPDFEKFPRHYTFSNCFKLSPKVVREFIRKFQYSVEGMAKVHQLVPTLSLPLFSLTYAFSDASFHICDNFLASLEQEHSNAPAFSICMAASAGRKTLVNFQNGSSVGIRLTSGMLKIVSGFALSVVVEFGDNHRNDAGFGIKCICRKSRTDLSGRREIIFHCWGPKEPPTVQEDHMFVFGCANMITAAEEMNHDCLGDIVKFEFHPVDWENNLLDESCTVKKCRVNLFTAATDDSTLRAKRPSSSNDREDLSSMEHMTSPYKKCRLKRVFETVILNLRKRKREMSVSTVKNRSKRVMEDCRFETSELQASFMMSSPLWSDSWSLCNAANCAGSIQIQQVAGITYVALPTVPMEMIQLGDLVSLKVAGDGLFPGLVSDEPPPMVDAAILKLFRHLKIKELELVGRKLVVITGHSTGGALAALTALWLLSQPSPPSFRLLCITFGSPLLGNQSLSTSISRSCLAHNFCHVVSIHDHVPRSSNDQFWSFGTYLFCSDNGGVCLDNAVSVRKMFLMLNTTRTPNIEEQERYGHYVFTLSHQFLKSRSFLGGNISDNSYQAGVALAVEALGFSNDDPSGVSVKECIETATRIGRAPILRSAELANELANVLSERLKIQWYKDRCDASEEQLGYYDFFKRYSMKRDYKVNTSRLRLARFWDGVLVMVETKELPFDFHLSKKWVYASQVYQLLAEPLDIAFFYKHRNKSAGHYLDQGNRHKRYEVLDKWWKQTGEREKSARSRYSSATQDTCFWARLEVAKECLDEVTREDIDAQRRSLLWEKIDWFEKYANTLVKNKDVSVDVLARRSSYSVWVENLREFKSRMGYGNGNQMAVDEIEEMET